MSWVTISWHSFRPSKYCTAKANSLCDHTFSCISHKSKCLFFIVAHLLLGILFVFIAFVYMRFMYIYVSLNSFETFVSAFCWRLRRQCYNLFATNNESPTTINATFLHWRVWMFMFLGVCLACCWNYFETETALPNRQVQFFMHFELHRQVGWLFQHDVPVLLFSFRLLWFENWSTTKNGFA